MMNFTPNPNLQIGTILESSGWRQGSIVKSQDISSLYQGDDSDVVLIVASQSCDIAQNNLKLEPFVEMSVGRVIPAINGSFSYGKNPRILHLELTERTSDVSITNNKVIKIIAFEKFCILKEKICDLAPSDNQFIIGDQLRTYVYWLASRYSRPALPTRFNTLISEADKRDKSRQIAKKISRYLSGLYIQITPDKEISKEDVYKANLLGLIPSGLDESEQEQAIESLKEYANIMRRAGIDVVEVTKQENEVSVADMKKFKRFYYDDLSLKDDHPLPMESNL